MIKSLRFYQSLQAHNKMSNTEFDVMLLCIVHMILWTVALCFVGQFFPICLCLGVFVWFGVLNIFFRVEYLGLWLDWLRSGRALRWYCHKNYMLRKGKSCLGNHHCESIDSSNKASTLIKILAMESTPPSHPWFSKYFRCSFSNRL